MYQKSGFDGIYADFNHGDYILNHGYLCGSKNLVVLTEFGWPRCLIDLESLDILSN